MFTFFPQFSSWKKIILFSDIFVFYLLFHHQSPYYLLTPSNAFRKHVCVCVHVQFVFYAYVTLCSRNALFRSWSPLKSSFNKAVTCLLKSPRAFLCVFDPSHKSLLVMHAQVSMLFCPRLGLPVTLQWLPSLAAWRWVQCRAARSRRQGIQQMCKYRMSSRLKRPSYVYWHSLQKRNQSRVSFPCRGVFHLQGKCP